MKWFSSAISYYLTKYLHGSPHQYGTADNTNQKKDDTKYQEVFITPTLQKWYVLKESGIFVRRGIRSNDV